MTRTESFAGEDGPLAQRARQFGVAPADLLPVLGADEGQEAPDREDSEWAIGRRIVRLDVEESLATVYLTFEDRTYLTFAARRDEEGVILLDRFCPPAESYEQYWVFEDLEGEIGPPPSDLPLRGPGFTPDGWKGAEGRTIGDIGWQDECMQAFLHLEGGGYLTFAANWQRGAAYLAGYFSPAEPEDAEGYLLFEPAPDDQE